MLRKTGVTVNDLATALELTDNAVRAHLAALEDEGLVRSVGVRRGVRKPHLTYGLTPDAEELFPKAYGPVLCDLLTVLRERLPAEEVDDAVREVGRRLAAKDRVLATGEPFDKRLERAMEALSGLGAVVEAEESGSGFVVRGESCPLTSAVVCEPATCHAAETFLEEIVGQPVRECCERGDIPRCRFEVSAPCAGFEPKDEAQER